MTQRCRLLVRAHMRDSICEPGHEFTLADGELGPLRSIIHAHETIHLKNDSSRIVPEYENEPLYEIWDGAQWVKPAVGARQP